jgi:RNA polymerase sigma-70 factor (ECF subfamily)
VAHLDAVYGFALNLTGNQMDAEDLVQDGYLRAFRHFDKFQLGTNFKAWMFTILRNLFKNERRRYSARAAHVDLDLADRALPHPDDSAQLDAEIEVHNGAVRAALDQLPETYRTTLWLGCMEGLTYEGIARVMGCPIGTVMSRMYRARKMLSEVLRFPN